MREHAVICARPIKYACTSEGECCADLRVWLSSVRPEQICAVTDSVSEQNGRFVRSLITGSMPEHLLLIKQGRERRKKGRGKKVMGKDREGKIKEREGNGRGKTREGQQEENEG